LTDNQTPQPTNAVSRSELLGALRAVEVIVERTGDKRHQLWRDFAIAAAQAMRLSIKAYGLEAEMESE
jgi:hypothetical protein